MRLLELSPKSLFGDEAILTHLDGREEISRPFEFNLSIASPKATLKPEDVVGKLLTVRIHRDDGEPRFINGYISHFSAGDFSETKDKKSAPFRQYSVRIVPWIAFMQYASRSFVFLPDKLEKSIHDVLDEVIKRVKSYGHIETWMKSNSARILKSRKVEHCVQYRETDLNFLTRTLEAYGVYYYFEHEEDKHTLVLSDMPNYPDCDQSKVEFPNTPGGHERDGILTSWQHNYEFVSGKFEQSDYNFKEPSSSLKASTSAHSRVTLPSHAGYELYDFPGTYDQREDGENEVVRKLEQEEARFDTIKASSNCRSFTPGYCFKISKHHSCKDEEGKSYLITSIQHSAAQPGEFSGSSEAVSYSNRFTCVPKDCQYRPPKIANVPVFSGVQTAIVVGPAGEEIYTDEYGRVKVQFYWDREGARDDKTSCWIRVSQNWAGSGWGLMQIPHIGHEVVVSFLNGNPDYPLIVGRVYNAEQQVPMPLPAEKTRSVLRDYGGNETVMEGKDGSQFIHTQQKCGNEFLMDGATGQEKIELRDKYGNEMVLDAVEGIIRIYSPTHESEIVLGRSINLSTLSDLVHEIKGEEFTKIHGPKHENIVGYSSKLIGGWKQETVVGLETKINLVAKFELLKAYCVKKKLSKEFETVKACKAQIHNDVLAAALSTKLAISNIYEVGAKDIAELGNKIVIHGEQSAEMIAAKADIQAKTAQMIGTKVRVEGASCDIKGKTDICSGALSVKGPPGKSPKSPRKRKSSKLSTPEAKEKKMKRQAQKAARRKNRRK